MNIHEAITASEYGAAAAEYHGDEIIVGADGRDGTYECEQVTSTGDRLFSQHGMTLDEVQRQFPRLNWWPIRENGDWGDETEAQYGGWR